MQCLFVLALNVGRSSSMQSTISTSPKRRVVLDNAIATRSRFFVLLLRISHIFRPLRIISIQSIWFKTSAIVGIICGGGVVGLASSCGWFVWPVTLSAESFFEEGAGWSQTMSWAEESGCASRAAMISSGVASWTADDCASWICFCAESSHTESLPTPSSHSKRASCCSFLGVISISAGGLGW